LEPEFFDRSALKVGRELIGKFLVRNLGRREIAAPINEVEIYAGFQDRASHAFRGKTWRNEVMWGDAGYFYVYFVYGMHWMLNVVVGRKNYPAAILIRGAGDWVGPAKITKALEIDKRFNGKIALPGSGLWFEDRGIRPARGEVKRLARVGVDYAKEWAEKPLRFLWLREIKKAKKD
jgi:DNA-3-methyladenine glycosylase